jgi:predicted metal-dependent peptidase
MHITFQHFDREVKPRKTWMIAADLAINSWLRHLFKKLQLPYHVPDNILFPEQYELPQLMSAGWYFNELTKDMDSEEDSSDSDADDVSDENSDDKQNSTSDNQNNDDSDGNENNSEDNSQVESSHTSEDVERGGHDHVDGCCGGEASEEESKEADRQGYSSTPHVVQEDIISKVAEELSRRVAGTGAGELAREIERLIKRKPVINWKTLLRKYLTYAAGRVGKIQTYQRPPRNGASGVIRPGRKWQGLKVVVIVDDSGSMSSELSWALSEVDAITKERFEVVYARCDVNITYHNSVEDLRKHLHCGGGTDILPAVEDAMKKHNPTVIVVLTDYCWSTYADSWRGCPVIIVDPTGYGESHKMPKGWHYVRAKKEDNK